jgi:hypothetical protein
MSILECRRSSSSAEFGKWPRLANRPGGGSPETMIERCVGGDGSTQPCRRPAVSDAPATRSSGSSRLAIGSFAAVARATSRNRFRSRNHMGIMTLRTSHAGSAASRPARLVPQCNTAPAVEKHQTFMCLSCGTSLERIAPESLTRHLFEFVHGDIWRHLSKELQDRVVHKIRWARGAKRPH